MKVRKYELGILGDTKDNLTRYAAHVHELNRKWWYTPEGERLTRSHPEMLALVVSELAEALEAARKDHYDDHLPEYKGLTVELADATIRLLDYAGSMSLPLWPQSFKAEGKVSEELFLLMRMTTQLWDCPTKELGNAIAFIIGRCSAMVRFNDPQIDFWEVVYAKLVYNQQRKDHSYEARAQAGGKKF